MLTGRVFGICLAVIPLTAAQLSAQQVIYVRAPVMASGQAVTEGQTVAPGTPLTTGAGGMVIVELRKWPAKDAADCTLFVIASGGNRADVPRRAGAQPADCGRRDQLSVVDRAFSGQPVSARVLLFVDGPADRPGGGLVETEIYSRLRRLTKGRRGQDVDATGRRGEAAGGGRGQPRAESTPETSRAGIAIESATYGANCGSPIGNVTSQVAQACNGSARCDYVIDHLLLGDPAPGCAKDYRVSYKCAPGAQRQTHIIEGEAGFKSVLRIVCQ